MVKLYQAQFPLDPGGNLDDAIDITKRWISDSPHRPVSIEDLSDLGDDGFEYTREGLTVRSLTEPDEGVWAMRMTERRNGDVFESDVVLQHEYECMHGAMSLSYHSAQPKEISITNSPRIVGDLVHGLPACDVAFSTDAKPYWMTEDEIDLAELFMNNQLKNQLPVVYLSRDNARNWTLIKPNLLAKKLAGMAHVAVEPSIVFSHHLASKVRGKNAYSGAAGIYWPNGMRWVVLPNGPRKMADEVYRKLQERAIFEIVPDLLRFDGIRATKRERRIEELQNAIPSDGSIAEAVQQRETEVLEMFVEEIGARDKRIGELVGSIADLENRLAEVQDDEQLIRSAGIHEVYTGEIRDWLCEALHHYAKHLDSNNPNSRKSTLIRKLVEENQSNEGARKLYDKLKRTLKGYTKFRSVEKEVKRMGFTVVSKGVKHPEVFVEGCESQKITAPSTTSDAQRTGNNVAANIRKKLF